jgi:hypothetical protein
MATAVSEGQHPQENNGVRPAVMSRPCSLQILAFVARHE